MKLTFRIRRCDAARGTAPYWQEYAVEAEPTERVLDALMRIKSTQDGTLGFRKSCAHGVCGSDAMRINGKDTLACKTLIRDVALEEGVTVNIEPLRHLPVLRDLIVDQGEFFTKFKAVKPYFINDEPVEEKERLQSIEERAAFDDATKCILCGSCYSACPVLAQKPNFLGPQAIAQAQRFNDDSRDNGFDQRKPVLDAPMGVWPCENHFECTRACPREIKITKLINQTKRALKA